MKPQSAKAKGRNLQKTVCAMLADFFKFAGLTEGDFLSRSMGANGTDVILSPAAKKELGNLAIECKNVENLNVYTTFVNHAANYDQPDDMPALVHKKNHGPVLCTVYLIDFIRLLRDRSIGE